MKRRNWIIFFAAYLLSAFGYEFIFFVMTIYVYETTRSPFNVGIFAALTFLPRLFASFYGILSDRYMKSKVFAIVAGITGVLISAMVLNSQLIWVYVTWLMISIFLTFIINLRTTLMSEIMTHENNLRGNSMVLMFLNIAKISAPFLAGGAMAVQGMKSLFFLIGGIYFLTAILSTWMDFPRAAVPKKRGKILLDIKEGLAYMKKIHDLRFLISVAFLWRLFIGFQISIFVVYVKNTLSGTDSDYGIFMAILGAGSIAGSLVGPWLLKRIPLWSLIFYGLSIHYASFILLGLLRDFNLSLLTVFTGYSVFYAALVGIHSLRDRSTREDIRGRVYGSVTAVLTPPAVFSMLAGGFLAKYFGAERVLIAGGGLALAGFYLLYLWKNRQAGMAREDHRLFGEERID